MQDESDDNILTRYGNYEFTTELGDDSWLSFLDRYFTVTQRKSREDEDRKPIVAKISGNGTSRSAIGIMAAAGIDALAPILPVKDSPSLAKDSPSLTKDSPSLTGGCGCSVKNYPMKFSISERVAQDPNAAQKTGGAPIYNQR